MLLLIPYSSDSSECKNMSRVRNGAALKRPHDRRIVTGEDMISGQLNRELSLRESKNIEKRLIKSAGNHNENVANRKNIASEERSQKADNLLEAYS